MKPKFAPFALVLALAALLSVPVGAPAVHWPNYGGDAGRSSLQPLDNPVTPFSNVWFAGDQRIQTSLVITAGGSSSVQRVAYGSIQQVDADTFRCNVQLRHMATGARIGPSTPHNICAGTNDATNANGFGTRASDGSVTPVDSSSANSFGQLFFVHNDVNAAATTETATSGTAPQTCSASTNDIAIAQIDEFDGTLVKDVAVGRPTQVGPAGGGVVSGPCGPDNSVGQISNGYVVDSSPLITPPTAAGQRDIYFIAHNGNATRLFRVRVNNAASKNTTYSFAYLDVPGANFKASPTLAYLRDPGRNGTPTQYVVVPMQNASVGGLATFRTIDFDAGPSIPGDGEGLPTGVPQTPATPIVDNGLIAGQPNSGNDLTSSIYVAFAEQDGKTTVRRFEQVGDSPNLTQKGAPSQKLDGSPSPALALTQRVVDGTPEANGRVVVSTTEDLHILHADSLALEAEYADVGEDPVNLGRTSPAATREHAFIAQANSGFPLAIRISDGELVCYPGDQREDCTTTEFADPAGNAQSTFAIGQGAISRNFVALASNIGAMIFRGVDETSDPATVEITQPADGGKLRGNAEESRVTAIATEPDAEAGITSVEFFVVDPTCGVDPKEGQSNWDGDNSYTITFDTTACTEGLHTLRAVAHSTNSPDAVDEITFEVDNKPDPVAGFTVAPDNEEPSGTEFTFTSSSTATGQGRTLTRHEWNFGDGTTFEGDGDAARTARHTYAQPGTYDVTLRVVQDDGEDDTETQTITVTNRPPIASFAASPNPAQINQEVSFDGSASQDPDGEIAKYEWDFDGDGAVDQTTTGPTTTHTYVSVGRRTVTLKVTDAAGATNQVSRDVEVAGPNVPPIASFSANPNPARANQQVVFDGTASSDPGGSIVKYEWDLDANGTYETDSGSNPRTQRAYPTAGVFNVKLRVTDNSGAQVETVRQLTVTQTTTIERVLPRSLTARTTPSRDRKLPYVFRTSGRLTLPAGVARVDGCNGRVTVSWKVGKKTISRRTTAVRSGCTYSTKVTFRSRKRLRDATRLRVIVRFQGNDRLRARSAPTRSVRIG